MTKRDSDAVEPDPASSPSRDLVLDGDRVNETGGYRVLRKREDRLEVGELRNLQEGKPITGEVVRLQPLEQHPRVFECETLHETSPQAGHEASHEARQGPPQVATAAYRKNWEHIFGALARRLDAADSDGSGKASPSKRKLN